MNKIPPLLALGALIAIGCATAAPNQSRSSAVDAQKPVTTDVQKIVAGNTQFALDLYQQLREQDGNLFYSPHSISTALQMTYAGANGETATEMAKVLHLLVEKERLHEAVATLQAGTTPGCKNPAYQLSVINALWGQKDLGFLPDFLYLTRTHYGAGLNEVDFKNDTEAARKLINDWVAEHTQNNIQELLAGDVLSADTRLVLTNAMYFKADWLSKFPTQATSDKPFYLPAGNKVNVATMHQTGFFGYHDDGQVKVLELPYAGNDISMVVLLPNKIDGLAALEKNLTPEALQKLMVNLQNQKVNVALPKFTISAKMFLADVLHKLGMTRAFDKNLADFSGMLSGPEKLYISKVIHQTFVAVTEDGTEAAAATAVVMDKLASAINPTPPENFRADHPFVFVIRDNRTGAILFMGRVADPRNG